MSKCQICGKISETTRIPEEKFPNILCNCHKEYHIEPAFEICDECIDTYSNRSTIVDIDIDKLKNLQMPYSTIYLFDTENKNTVTEAVVSGGFIGFDVTDYVQIAKEHDLYGRYLVVIYNTIGNLKLQAVFNCIVIEVDDENEYSIRIDSLKDEDFLLWYKYRD